MLTKMNLGIHVEWQKKAQRVLCRHRGSLQAREGDQGLLRAREGDRKVRFGQPVHFCRHKCPVCHSTLNIRHTRLDCKRCCYCCYCCCFYFLVLLYISGRRCCFLVCVTTHAYFQILGWCQLSLASFTLFVYVSTIIHY